MKSTVIIIEEKIEVGQNEVADVDASIIAEMKAKLNPTMNKPFSYASGDHLKDAVADEKRMREKLKA